MFFTSKGIMGMEGVGPATILSRGSGGQGGVTAFFPIASPGCWAIKALDSRLSLFSRRLKATMNSKTGVDMFELEFHPIISAESKSLKRVRSEGMPAAEGCSSVGPRWGFMRGLEETHGQREVGLHNLPGLGCGIFI